MIGKRVLLEHLMFPNQVFPGVIVENMFPWESFWTVKLDGFEKPVRGVLYFDEVPEVINSPQWQFCYPETEKPAERANPDEPSCVLFDLSVQQ